MPTRSTPSDAARASEISFIRDRLPKAELHCHIEGTIRAQLAREMARQYGEPLAVALDKAGNYVWRDFAEFIAVYDAIARHVRSPADYEQILYHYFRSCAGSNLIYGEVFISLDHGLRDGSTYPELLTGLERGIDRVLADFGIIVRMILVAVRHLGAARAFASAEAAHLHPHPYVVGFGMAGDESFGRLEDFAPAFEHAKEAGLRLTAHAGELVGPHSVSDALDILGVERLGHGVRAVEDEALLHEIHARQIPFELCPSSNIALGLYPDLARHPVGLLLRAGHCVTLNTDDPGFFGEGIGEEYAQVATAHDLDAAQMRRITHNAIGAAFCSERDRDRLFKLLEANALP